ncbi:MAG: hypothetical protein ACI8UO_002334 [Verrucomicrobiales bacterium]|jgi:hypothetical protein
MVNRDGDEFSKYDSELSNCQDGSAVLDNVCVEEDAQECGGGHGDF